MAVMLTLNLKKPDSSQFISEIQYGKDFWAFVIQKKTNLYLLDKMIFLKSRYFRFLFFKIPMENKRLGVKIVKPYLTSSLEVLVSCSGMRLDGTTRVHGTSYQAYESTCIFNRTLGSLGNLKRT